MKRFDWKYLAMLFATIAAVIVPVWLWVFDINSRSLSVLMVSRAELSPKLEGHEKALLLTLDGKQLESAYVTVLEVTNDGAKPIPASDFESPIELRLDSKTSLLRAALSSAVPKDLSPLVDTHADHISVKALLLNPKDSFRISVITNGEIPQFKAKARITGLPSISIREKPKSPYQAASWISLLTAFLFSLAAGITMDILTSQKVMPLRRRAAVLISLICFFGFAVASAAFSVALAVDFGIGLFVLLGGALMFVTLPIVQWLNKPLDKSNGTVSGQPISDNPVTPPITAASLRAGFISDKYLNDLSMPGENLSGASFSYKSLKCADFSNCNLEGTMFQGSNLRDSKFTGANLTRTCFHGADLRGADLSNTTIVNTDFQKARLEGANLKVESLSKADLRATYDSSTIWPDNFDPIAAGAVLIE
jgi:hypothetical protein